MIPEVAALGPGNIAASAAHHQHATDRWAAGQGLVDVLFQRDAFAATHAFIGGDHGAAVGIENAVSQGIGEKPPNTTEWMAPMRVQASMAKAASGIIGM